jgi:hypothetical protein
VLGLYSKSSSLTQHGETLTFLAPTNLTSASTARNSQTIEKGQSISPRLRNETTYFPTPHLRVPQPASRKRHSGKLTEWKQAHTTMTKQRMEKISSARVTNDQDTGLPMSSRMDRHSNPYADEQHRRIQYENGPALRQRQEVDADENLRMSTCRMELPTVYSK